MRTILSLAMLFATAGAAAAQGLIIPVEPDVPPLALTRHAVKVEIDRQAALTTVEQVFTNHTERQLEAQYVFPIPKGAVVSRFTMMVDGKELAGEILEKGKARHIYNQIVSRSEDPGLLEYLGNDIFRANIFPIAPRGSRTITIRFDQVLPAEGTLVNYTYPLRASGRRGPTVHGEFSIDVAIRSHAPIQNIYSPSHSVSVTRAGEREARVSFGAKNIRLEKDFQIYYGTSDSEVGLNLVTWRPDPKQPGYFMLLVSPRSAAQAGPIAARDIVFVIDTSGSMSGEKIKQARGALKHCIASLNDGDRFNIVRFSGFVEPWKNALVPAAENRRAALEYAETLLAEGATNIAGAIDAALAYPRDPARPYFIVFMTDGKPTVGETTDPVRILAKVRAARDAAGGQSIRLFTWGVGYDLDTQLLDGMAAAGGGLCEYVKPEEDIEAKVSAFWNKAGRPVLTHLDFAVLGEKVRLVNVYPRQLPDLYAGSQFVLFGRYTGEGDVALRLAGRVNEKTETFTYEGTFPASERKNAFIESLWAQRRIGSLLEQIRLGGETKELVDDVIRLSLEYGIQTPYTSYLILEEELRLGAARQSGGAHRPLGATSSGEKKSKLDGLADKEPATLAPPRAAQNEFARSLAEGFERKDGKSAVDTASYVRRLRESDRAGDRAESIPYRKAAGTRFYEYRALWVDERYEADHAVTTVKFGSAAYFKILVARPEIVEALKVGASLVYVTATGKALVVSSSGLEELADAQITELFTPASK